MRVAPAFLILATAIICSPDSLRAASPFRVRAGVGYDYLSQEFYQDSLQQSGADSIFVSFLLRNEYLNDFKGILSVRFEPEKKPLDATVTYEQASSQFRLTAAPNLRFSGGKTRFRINSDLEWRGSSDNTESGSDYLFGSTRLGATTPFSDNVSLLVQGGFDGVNFVCQNETGIDYYRLNAGSGISWHLSDITSLETRLLFTTRQVPDSQRLEYRSYGADISLVSFGEKSSLDLYGFGEYKNYQNEPDEDDLTDLELSGRFRQYLSQTLFCSLEGDGELDLFHKNDPINTNVGRLRTAILGGWTNDRLTVAVGPEWELLNEAGSSSDGEDYTELGGRVDVELISSDQIFISFSGSSGRRDLIHEDPLRSDFIYGRLNLFGDWRLFHGLHLNALASVDREWNEISTNSGTTYIASSSLLYEF